MSSVGWLAAAIIVAVTLGCADDEISVYSIPKQRLVDEQNVVIPDELTDESGPDRMLGAVLVHEREGWFFKLTGKKDAVAATKPEFRSLLESVKFTQGGTGPTWDLPEGWQSKSGSQGRFATLEIPVDGGPALELAVTKLPVAGWPTDEYLLANVNRWRQQMGLPIVGRSQLTVLSEQVAVGDSSAMVVDLVGTLAEGDMKAPFAHGGGMAAGAGGGPGATRPPGGSASEPEDIKFDKPDAWRPAPRMVSRGGITLRYAAAFTAGEGDKQVEVTVSSAGGALLPNVNRWRGQIGLAPMSEVELQEAIEPLSIGTVEATYIELFPEQPAAGDQAILGAIAEAEGQVWFFKLMGDATIAEREKANFRSFVQSVQFE